MANQVNVEISANVTGYVQGMNQAEQATKKYETEQRKIKDSTINLNAELRRAKKEATNLGAAYAQLSAEEKRSQFGQEMKRQLDAAMSSAAEFIDLQGDLREQMKNLASDTKVLDSLAEGIGVVGDVVSASAGIFAQLTGREEDAQRALVMFTTAQSALGAVTKITNALQLQSNTMLAVQKVQELAAAAAVKIKTAAESRGVVVTKAASVAQALFNKIAMANPYVLLAMAIVGVVAALASFIAFTGDASDEQAANNKTVEEAKELQDAYYSAYNSNLSETMVKYTDLQREWKNLKSEGEKNQWIHDNIDAFHELGFEITNTGEAESVFVINEAAVIQSFIARAEAAALAAQAVTEFNQALEGSAKPGETHTADYFAQYGIDVSRDPVHHHGGFFHTGRARYTVTEDYARQIREQRMNEARKNVEELGKMQLKAEERQQEEIAKAGVKAYNKERDKQLKKSGGGSTGKHTTPKQTVKVEPVVDPNSLEAAEKALKQLEEKRTKISVDDPDLDELLKDIEFAKKEIERRKIKLKIEASTTSADELSEIEKAYNKAVSEAGSKLVLAQIKGQPIEDILALTDEYEAAKNALESYQQTKKVLLESEAASTSTDLRDALSGEFKASIQGYTDAISQLQNALSTNPDWSTLGQGGGLTWDDYIAKIQEYKETLASLQEVYDDAMLTPQEKLQKKLDETADKISVIADAINAAGELFSALGEVADNEGLNVAGIVAKAIATVALSYAQALSSAKTWVEWLAFGLTGLGTMVSMISQIKSATHGYAEGGIVGGSSYSGDNVLARLNSGEMVLNNIQQKRLFDLLDGKTMSNGNAQRIEVIGKIRGTDLLLVQKNTNKKLSKANSTISIG